MPAPTTTACFPIKVDAIASSSCQSSIVFAHCLDSETFASEVGMSQSGPSDQVAVGHEGDFGAGLQAQERLGTCRRSSCRLAVVARMEALSQSDAGRAGSCEGRPLQETG